jgi:hypothetical protein
MSFCMFHIHALWNIYIHVVNQQMHTDKICLSYIKIQMLYFTSILVKHPDGRRSDRNM